MVLAVRHEAYMKLDPDAVISMTGRPVAVIDCFGILDESFEKLSIMSFRPKGEILNYLKS